MPKIGIVLSTYNRPDGLQRMVDSVFNQDWQDWILYLCDDYSTDSTAEICEKLAAENRDKVRHLRQPKNWGNVTRGRNDAILYGLDKDGITHFVFSDDDNTWKPNRLITQLHFMLKNDCGASWCNCEGIRDGRSIGRLRQDEPRAYDRKYLLKRPYIDSNELMVKAEVFEHIGLFDERLKTLEDWDFTLRAGLQFKVLHLEADLINYGLHDSNRVQKTLHLNGQSCQLMGEREKLAGPRYRVLFVKPAPWPSVINHSHEQVMGYIENALARLPFTLYKSCIASEPVQQIADDFQPNLIIYFYPARIPSSATSWLGSRPYPSLGLCVEDPYAHELNKQVRPIYEWFITNEQNCLADYKTHDKPYALVMPSLSADSQIHKAKFQVEKEIDILLVGAPYDARVAVVQELATLGKKLVVAGEGWQSRGLENVECINRNLSGEEYAELIAKSRLVLIVNRTACSSGVPQTPARGFIEAYAGACMLMQDDRAGLSQYFEADKEYVGWQSVDELKGKISQLLADGKRCRQISEAACKRAQSYTYERRLTRLFMLTRGYRANDEVK